MNLKIKIAEVAFSAALIIMLTFSAGSLVANFLSLSPQPSGSFSPPLYPGGSQGQVEPFQSSSQAIPSAPFILGGFLLLVAFLMVWLRDRLIVTLKEMIIMLAAVSAGSFVYIAITTAIRPSISFKPFSLNPYILLSLLAAGIATGAFFIIRKNRYADAISTGNFVKEVEQGGTSSKDYEESLPYNEESDVARLLIFKLYLSSCDALSQRGLTQSRFSTPREYLERAEAAFPQLKEEMLLLTLAFEIARYSKAPVDKKLLNSAKKAASSLFGKLGLRGEGLK